MLVLGFSPFLPGQAPHSTVAFTVTSLPLHHLSRPQFSDDLVHLADLLLDHPLASVATAYPMPDQPSQLPV